MAKSPKVKMSKKQLPTSSTGGTREIMFYPEDGKTYRPFRSPSRLKAMDDKKNRGNAPVSRVEGIPENLTACWSPDSELNAHEPTKRVASAPASDVISKSAETKISAATCDASPTATGYGLGDLAESQRSEPSLSTAGFSHDTAQCVANGMQCVAQHASPDQAPLHLEGQTGLCMTYGVDSPRCKPHRINTNIPLVEELSFLTSTASAYTDGSVPWTDSSDSSYDSPSSFFLLTPEGGNSDLQGGNRDIMEYNGAMPHELDVGSFLPESIGEQSSEPLSKSDDPYVNYLAPFTSNGFTYQPSTGSLFTPSIAGFDTECTIPHIDPLHNQQFALPIDHSVISGQPLDETSTCIFQFPRSPATSFTPQESDVAHMLCSGSMLNPQFLSYHIV